MNAVLLETDVLSEVLKGRNTAVARRAIDYSRLVGPLAFSAVTRFEIIRGLKSLQATAQLTKFAEFCKHAHILLLDDNVFDVAAELWVEGRAKGHPHGDADLLIAATALANGFELATRNRSHFAWIAGLTLVDWLR
jgi:tRNA(fMet)-specific endonuclease VapC